jgi:hypothetical protein
MDDFNPYHEWLGLDRDCREPTHYELLSIAPDEPSAEIAAAAVVALCRVRKCRPGPRAAQWAHLFDELVAAKKMLCDPPQRAEYDRQLAPRRPSPALPVAPPDSPPAQRPLALADATRRLPAARRGPMIQAVDVAHRTLPAPHLQRHTSQETAARRLPRMKWLALPLTLATAFAAWFLRSA